MNWIKNQHPILRMTWLSILLGIIGALSGLAFIWLLLQTQSILLGDIAHYTPPTVSDIISPTLPLELWWIPIVTTFGGLISGVLVFLFAPEAEGHGTDAFIKSFHQDAGFIRGRVPIIKALASAITIGSGGSAGREGPVAQIAAGTASRLSDALGLTKHERRQLTVIGTAAGLAAIFKSPLGSAFFAIKVLYSGSALESSVLYYSIIAAAIAYSVIGLFNGWAPLFVLPIGLTFEHPLELIWYLVLGLAVGVVGAVLPSIFYGVRDAFHKIPIPAYLKPALGGLMLGIIAMYLPEILGGGYGWIQFTIDDKLPITLLAILVVGKIIAMALTVGSGGSGGIFAPTLFVGAMLGGLLSSFISQTGYFVPDHAAVVIIATAALFGCASRAPVASLIMIIEMTGSYGIAVPAMITVVVSLLIQKLLTHNIKYPTLYEAQVVSPTDSPAHQPEYLETVINNLRQQKIQLPANLITQEASRILSSGGSISLPNGKQLSTLQIDLNSPVEGKKLFDLDFISNIKIIAIFQGETMITQIENHQFKAGDWLIIISTQMELTQAKKNFFHNTNANK
jgi:CIC family chloride channel protein